MTTRRYTKGDRVVVSLPGSDAHSHSATTFTAYVVRADYAINGRCTGVVVVKAKRHMNNEDAHMYVSPARYVTLKETTCDRELTFDEAQARGFDATGQDGDSRFPYHLSDVRTPRNIYNR